MYVEIAKRAEASPKDSVDSVLFDCFNLIRVGGFRIAEYTHKTQIRSMSLSMVRAIRLLRPLFPQIGVFIMLPDVS